MFLFGLNRLDGWLVVVVISMLVLVSSFTILHVHAYPLGAAHSGVVTVALSGACGVCPVEDHQPPVEALAQPVVPLLANVVMLGADFAECCRPGLQ